MSKDQNPKTLTLPEPAAGLWKAPATSFKTGRGNDFEDIIA